MSVFAEVFAVVGLLVGIYLIVCGDGIGVRLLGALTTAVNFAAGLHYMGAF